MPGAGGVDTSSYTVPQTNAFDYAQRAVALRQSVLANQAAQQKFVAQQAYGKIINDNIDQQTGQLDFNKAFLQMSQNPQTAFMAPDFLDKGVARQQTQADTALKQLELQQKRYATIGSGASGLLTLGDNLTRDDVIKLATDYRTDGVLDSDGFINFVKSIPAEKGPQLQNFVRQYAVRGQSAADAMKNVLGEYQWVDQGGQKVLMRLIPGQQPQTVAQSGMTPTPAELNKLVDFVDPVTGQKRQAPAWQVQQMTSGVGGPVQGARPAQNMFQPQQGQPPAATPYGVGGGSQYDRDVAGNSPITQGAVPPAGAVAPSTAPGGDAQAQGGGAFGGAPSPAGIQVGLSPFEEERSKNAAKYSENLNAQVDGGNAALKQLATMEDLTKKIQTGGGANVRSQLAELVRAGVGTMWPKAAADLADKINAGDTGALQEFRSLAFNFMLSQMKTQLPAGDRWSNNDMQSFADNKINLENDPRAIESMMKYYSQMVQMKYMEQQEFEYWTEQGKSPARFQAYWAKKLRDGGVIKPMKDEK